MRIRVIFAGILALAVSACSGSFHPAPLTASSNQLSLQSALELTPSSVDLTPGAPSDTFNAQNDSPGVSYTPRAAPACTGSGGGIVVSGDGFAQLDVANAPLVFTVFAYGSTPPAECTITVSGSDGSSSSVDVNFSAPQITDIPQARERISVASNASPVSLTFSSLAAIQAISVSGFSGTTTASVTCQSATSGIQVTPKQLSGSGTFNVMPFGQGKISNSCTITITDQHKTTATVKATLSIGALAKLTATPSSTQFGCAGSTAPYTCQTSSGVQISEAGQQTYKIVTRPSLTGSCANAFYGPLNMTTNGTSFTQSVTGSSVDVTFAGLLPAKVPSCSQIVVTDSNTPAQRVRIAVASTTAAAPASLVAATPPPCTGTAPRVADPSAPHGMYVWNPYKVQSGIYESYLEKDVIGKDPNLCGVSLLISWSTVEKTKGTFNWSQITNQAKPYVQAGLTVNLLFADASEVGSNTATPAWVTDPVSQGGDGVATISCSGQPDYPNYIDPTFEADYEDFISHAVAQFANDPSIGYMRFGIGMGVEALPGHLNDYPNDACSKAFIADGYSFDNWVAHSRRIIDYLGSLHSTKQLMVAMNYIQGWSGTLYDYPNAVALAAASRGIAFGTENLGIGHVADPGTTPAACNPQGKNASIYWCQAFTRHVGKVPFEFQPIESVIDPLPQYNIDFNNLLQYALDNNTQLFELYPQDWLEADSPTSPVFKAANQAEWKAALSSTALIVGAHAP